MKLAFVTTYNAQDVRSWSGTSFYMSKAFIDAGIEIEYIEDLKPMKGRPLSFKFRDKIYNQLLKNSFGNYQSYYEPRNLKYIAKQVQKKLEISDADIVFSPGALPIAYLDTNKPIVMWTDATFAALYNYYTELSNFDSYSVKNCHRYEKEVLKRTSLAIFSSEWAAKSAIDNYGANPDKVKVVSYGANIQCDRTSFDIHKINKAKENNICKLLFVGQDWERKGGQMAVNIAKAMNEKEIKTELTIVGCTPPASSFLPDFVKVLGFIDKSKKEGMSLINELYCNSHFFVLPTIAECTPIVFSEANSFGLPVITINTGGVSSVIRNDVNGKMFNIDMNVKECATYIADIFTNFDKYSNISQSSFNEYKTRLNWEVAISNVIFYLNSVFKNSK